MNLLQRVLIPATIRLKIIYNVACLGHGSWCDLSIKHEVLPYYNGFVVQTLTATGPQIPTIFFIARVETILKLSE